MSNYSLPTPTALSDVVFHSAIEQRLIMDIANGAKAFPSSGKNGLLLWGDYGTGKTTLANLLPEAIEQGKTGQSVLVVDNFACNQTLIGPKLAKDIYDRACHISGNHSNFHYFVLDEVDNLTDSAQKSLKSVMNLPNTVFVLTTNFVKRIDAGVKNRCVQINCNAAPAQAYLPIAKQVLAGYGALPIADQKLLPIIEQCKGSVREITDYMERLAAMQHAQAHREVVLPKVAVTP